MSKKLTKDNKLLIEKNIYLNRQGKTREQMIEIINLEISTHLIKFKDVDYSHTEEVKNDFRGRTYLIHFKIKKNEPSTRVAKES